MFSLPRYLCLSRLNNIHVKYRWVCHNKMHVYNIVKELQKEFRCYRRGLVQRNKKARKRRKKRTQVHELDEVIEITSRVIYRCALSGSMEILSACQFGTSLDAEITTKLYFLRSATPNTCMQYLNFVSLHILFNLL